MYVLEWRGRESSVTERDTFHRRSAHDWGLQSGALISVCLCVCVSVCLCGTPQKHDVFQRFRGWRKGWNALVFHRGKRCSFGFGVHFGNVQKPLSFDRFERGRVWSETVNFAYTYAFSAKWPLLSLLVQKVMQKRQCFTLLFDMVPFGDFWSEKVMPIPFVL